MKKKKNNKYKFFAGITSLAILVSGGTLIGTNSIFADTELSNKYQNTKMIYNYSTNIIDQQEGISLSKLNSKVWIHTSTVVWNGTPVPANGLVLETSKGLVLIDTPVNDELTSQLIQQLKKQFPNKKITDAIVTHFHDDSLGGIKALLNQGIKVHSTKLTADLAEAQGHARPLGDLKDLQKMKFGNVNIEIFYPGKGHTQDNIVVWLPKYKTLFGGCFIKSLKAQDLGNIADADINEWPDSIQKVRNRYKAINSVVPGHGSAGDSRLLNHTLNLLQNK